MTNKQITRLYWVGFGISLTVSIISGLLLLVRLIIYLLNK